MTTLTTNEQGKPTSPPTPKTYDFHLLANLFPLMTPEEFKVLVDDIRTSGLRQPIVLYQHMILDGRHRYNAAKEAKIELTEKDFIEFTGNDPLKFVIS
jgi:ParB-like chromosome segregation protein Spo0J